MQQAFEGKNRWYLYLAGTGLVLIGFFAGQLPLTIILGLAISKDAQGVQQEDFTTEELLNLADLSNNLLLFLMLLSFVGAILFLFIAVKQLHGKRILAIVTAAQGLRSRRLIFGFAFWLFLSVAFESISYMISPETYVFNLQLGKWLLLILISILFLPVQCAFEELFCRGYLMQAGTLLFRHPLIAILLTTIVFSSLHLANPEVSNFGAGIMIAYYGSVGALLAMITILDEGLELAIGIHAATNIYGAVFVNFNGSALQTDSLIHVTQINAYWMLLFFLLSMAIFLSVASRKYAWKWQKLFIPVKNPAPDEHYHEAQETDV